MGNESVTWFPLCRPRADGSQSIFAGVDSSSSSVSNLLSAVVTHARTLLIVECPAHNIIGHLSTMHRRRISLRHYLPHSQLLEMRDSVEYKFHSSRISDVKGNYKISCLLPFTDIWDVSIFLMFICFPCGLLALQSSVKNSSVFCRQL